MFARLAGATLAASLVGLVPAQSKTEVILWGIGMGADSKGYEALFKEFERRNPDIRVKVLGMGAGGMNPQKLMTSIVGNVAPDVIYQDRFTISDWASRGAFESLDGLISRDAADPLCPKPEDFYPACWNEVVYEGKVYGVPSWTDNRILYYNKSIFREKAAELRAAGLDPDRPPRTWSELLAYSKVLTEKNPDGSLKRAGFMPLYGNSWLYMFAFMNNASFISPDGRRCTLSSPEAEESLEFMKKGYEVLGGYENARKFESGFLRNENDAFVRGKVALKIDLDDILNNLSRYAPQTDFGTAPPPVPDDRYYRRGRFANEKEQVTTWSGGHSYAIPRGARHVDAAWELIKFATSVEGHLIYAKGQRDWERRRGRVYMPKLIANWEATKAVFAQLKPPDKKFADAIQTHVDMMPHSRFRPVTFAGQVLWDAHVREVENALYGRKTTHEALLDGQNTVQRELDLVFDADTRPVVDLRIPAGLFGTGLLGLGVFCVAAYRKRRLSPVSATEARWAYLFVSPWVIGFLVFVVGPMAASLFFSFTQYNVLSDARWVGAKNYVDVFTTDWSLVSKAFSNAAYLAGVGVPLGLCSGLAIALLLNAAVRGMRFYRTLFYMPSIVPTVAAAVLWSWILSSDPNKGLINGLWKATFEAWMGLSPPGWLSAEAWSKPALILMGLWGAGGGMILWLAGLKGVPTSLYEASEIDGAGSWRQFWSVTFPQLSPVVFFNVVMGFIGGLQEFDRVFIMKPSEGAVGPADSMLVPVFHLFVNGFNYFKMGYASALAWILFTLILLLTLFQFKLAPKWVHYEVEK